MENKENVPQAPGLNQCAKKQEKSWEITGKDRGFLGLTGLFCLLMVDTVLFYQPGLGITVLVMAWYGLLRAYLGRDWLRAGESRALLAVNLFLGLTFALTSSWAFRLWNLGALLVLVPLQALAASEGTLPWWRPAMLRERLTLLFQGLFGNLGAAGAVLSRGKGGERKRTVAVLLGCCAALALVAVLLPVLAGADALFAALTEDFLTFCREHFTTGGMKLCMALVITPFAFGLLYRLKRPEPLKKAPEEKSGDRDGVAFAIALAALCGMYALFLAVQLTGILGGEAYLAEKGISYAEWARSGFFQMVGVTAVNLLAAMTALGRSRREGRWWTAVRGLSGLLAAESLALLVSACWRMSLYVSAYGLSFKRLMTYWGMGMMAIFLTAALWKAVRPDFRFWRMAFPAAVAGWLLINCVPVDYLAAKDQVDRYLSGQSQTVDVGYLAWELSYDALHQLERLDPGTGSGYYGQPGFDSYGEMPLGVVMADRKLDAAEECGRWESWNLSAWLVSHG